MFVARRGFNNFVFAYSSEHCRESLAAVTVCICQREDIRISFAETLNYAHAGGLHFRNTDKISSQPSSACHTGFPCLSPAASTIGLYAAQQETGQ
jgi:hypothetical protein